MIRSIRLFAICCLAVGVRAQDGPAILVRGEAPAALNGTQFTFRPYGAVSGIYDSGLAGVSVGPDGQLSDIGSAGVELSGGIAGVQSWKHTRIGLDYRGSFYHYTNTSYFDGTEQNLMLGITRQLSKYSSLNLRQNAGLFARGYALLSLSQTANFDPSQSYIPVSPDFFDNRTFYVSTQADYTIQKSRRLSFSLGGNGFLTRRRSTALYGVRGAGARADIQYRVSRRSTLGVAYTYSYYTYTDILSTASLHGAVATYGLRLTKNLEVTGYGGVMRAETDFIQNIPLDPAIVALVGSSYATAPMHQIQYVPNVSGRLSRTLSRGVAYVSGGHTVTPGNGVYLTSRTTNVMAGYTYSGFKHWSVNTYADYVDALSIANIVGHYGDVGGGVSAAHELGQSLHAVVEFNVRQYRSVDFSGYNRRIYSLRFGIGYSPGETPLRRW